MENLQSGDQRRQRIRQLIREHSDMLREQGAVVETWRRRGDRRVGPYFSVKFRVGSRQRSFYLGTDRQLADEVRAELAKLQRPLKRRRWYRRQEQVIRRELTRSRRGLGRELLALGLAVKGSEIRGWRHAAIK